MDLIVKMSEDINSADHTKVYTAATLTLEWFIPVSPTIFLFHLFLFRLFPVSPISCFDYFPIVCSNPHVRSRLTLPVGNNSAEVSGTGYRTWYRVCEFLRGRVSP
jgi:hypothetical protein